VAKAGEGTLAARAGDAGGLRSVADPAGGLGPVWRAQDGGVSGAADAARELARDLIRMMDGGPMGEAPMWHMTFLYRWRADHLGPEVAAMDRARAAEHPWAEEFWDEDGRLKPLWALDEAMLRLHRAEWREQMGLPDGEAVGVP
jgi:hypothetical protein